MKYLIGFVFFLSLISCEKLPDTPELEENRFVYDILNTVSIEDVVVKELTYPNCITTIYFSLDQIQFETDWDEIENIKFRLIKESPGGITGEYFAKPDFDLSNRFTFVQTQSDITYFLTYVIVLKNGRSSNLKSYTIRT